MTGGDSRRMKTNKSVLKINGKSLTEHVYKNLDFIFDNIYIVGKKNNFPHYNFIEDIESVQCPLNGIITSLEQSKNDWIFVIACDLPFVDPVTIRHLHGQIDLKLQVVLPKIRQKIQPLCAFYNKSALNHFKNAISSADHSIHASLGGLLVKEIIINDSDSEQFLNINRPDDLDKAYKLFNT